MANQVKEGLNLIAAGGLLREIILDTCVNTGDVGDGNLGKRDGSGEQFDGHTTLVKTRKAAAFF
jgi:hypothetical protein